MNKNVKILLGALGSWLVKIAVTVVKGRAYAEMRKEMAENARKQRQNIEEKQKTIREKYIALRRNLPK